MKRLVETESFELLFSNNSKTATDNLIWEIIRLGETEANLASLYRIFHYTRFHLGGMAEKSEITTELGKKCIGATLCH
ncbi:ribosome biogenesis protein [Bacteroides pyogenes]|uniref:ribosome biogenesis protein n=1 Tax=Bacteroides pyogenes TaxID=310300 RepID=UPI002A7EF09B|nr:ribosome biogenesis protein [Bacteroides pyogenes]MDY4249543.1 ribosome biogenesis protein [Bacteroides pyogenes]